MTVVQHFDEAVRHTTYDTFVDSIRARTALAGFLMAPDAAFGFERRGTPDTLAALGERDGFDVVVVPTFTLDGRSVRSSDVRVAIAAGDLVTAAALLGRPVTIRGDLHGGVLTMPWPIAMPPDGDYSCTVDGAPAVLTIHAGDATLTGTRGRVGHVSVTMAA